MTIIKYRTGYYMPIDRVEVKSETEHFVIFPNGRRDKKLTDGFCYFDTWDKAWLHLVERANRKVVNAANSLLVAQAELERTKALEPEE